MAIRRIRFKRLFIITSASLLIVAGLLAGMVRLADLAAPGYREDLAEWVSQRLNRPISIGAMDMLWGWHGPVLALGDVALLSDDGRTPVITLRDFEIHFSLLDLIQGEKRPRGLTLAGTSASVYRDAEGRFRLVGLKAGRASFDLAETARWLQSLSFIRIADASVAWLGDGRDSPPTLRLDTVNAELSNRGPRHRLNASAQLPETMGGRLEFEAFVFGDLATPRQARAHSYLKAERLDIAALLNMAGVKQVSPQGERSLLEAWSDWEKGHFSGARVALASASLDSEATGSTGDDAAPANGLLLPPGMGVDLSVYPDPLGYRLNVDAVKSASGQFSEVGGGALLDVHGPRLQAELTRVPAAVAAAVLRAARPQLFASLTAEGMLPRLSARYDGSGDAPRFSSNLSFSGLSVYDPQRGLRVGSISGSLDTHNKSGRLRIDHGSGALQWPPFVRGDLPIDQLAASLTWEQPEPGRWLAQLAQLDWAGADSRLDGQAELAWADGQTPALKADANAASDDVRRLLAHLTLDPDLPLDDVRSWLHESIRSGRVTNATIRSEGPLDRFPYFDGSGDFEVQADIENAELDYKPGWPAIRNANGALQMRRQNLSFTARSGRFLDIPVAAAKGRISDLRKPILKIEAETPETAASNLFAVLEKTPLREDFGAVTRALDIGGRARGRVTLDIPLKSELGDVRVSGEADLLGARLVQDMLPRPIDGIRGTLKFDREAIYASQLRGNLGGIPLVADIGPGEGGSLTLDASALPRLPAHRADIESVVPGFVLDAVSGESLWHVALRITDKGQLSDLTLRSDLKGLAINLPRPVAKTADQSAPVRVTVVADGSRVHVDMAGRVDVGVKLRDGSVDGVGVVFGPGGEPAPVANGLRVTGRIDVLDGEAWYDFISELSAAEGDRSEGAAADSLPFNSINLSVGATHIWGQRVGETQVKVLPYQGRGYEVDFAGEGGRGNITWLPAPPRQGARDLLTGRINNLVITNFRPESAGQTPAESLDGGLEPANLPITDIRVGSLSVNGREFGSAVLQGRAAPDGITLSDFTLSGGELDAHATGTWIRSKGLTSANLSAEIAGSGVETLFRLLDYSPTLRADETLIQTNLNVSPNAAGLAPAHLQGNLRLRVKDGVLLNVEPGAGRVLGLFNFYALPRRLNLDFSDVLSQGMAFDEIKGDFNISNGVAHTDGLTIDTSSAEVEISGAINLAERSYDQRVRIEPQLSSGVALAGTVIGGPAVGAALLIAQRLLKKPIKKLSRITYYLRGSWDDPEIETVETE